MNYIIVLIFWFFGVVIFGSIIQMFFPHIPDESLPDEERFQDWYDED